MSGLPQHPSQAKRVFRNFLLIYLSFALCMLMLLLVPLYLVSLREAEERTLNTASETLHSGMSVLEAALKSAVTAADTLYAHRDVSQLGLLGDTLSPQDAYAVREALNTYRAIAGALPFTTESGLHYANGSMIAGNRFFLHAQDAFDSGFPSAYIYEHEGALGQSFSQLLEYLDITGRPYSLTGLRWGRLYAQLRDSFVYAVALPLNTAAKSTFFYAVYDAGEIADLLVLPQYQRSCRLTLTGADGKAFLVYDTAAEQDARFVEVSCQSPLYTLTATLQIDRAVFSGQLHAFRAMMLIIAAAYILIGILLALLFSWRNSQPMARVIHAAEQTGIKSGVTLDASQPVNSYQYIHALIDGMGREISAAHRKQELQRVQLQESMFDRLLRGDLYHESSLKQARSFFPDFPACSCMILMRLLHSHEMDIATLSDAQLRLSDVFKSHLPPDMRVHFFSNLTVLICPCEEAHYQETCANLIASLTPHLSRHPDLAVRFAVSTPLHGIDELSRVFQQLRHLLHIVGDTGESVFFMQDSEPTAAQAHSYSSTRFYEMLLRGECDVALSLMEEDVRRLRQGATADETEVQQLFFIYRHELMRVKEEFALTAPADLSLPALPDYLPQLSVDEMFGELRCCCRALCECINSSRVSERESFERRLLAYIDEHLSDPTLCVRAVIDQFSISESTLRNILVQCAGVNFSEYVENHRMRQAQLLVEHSTIPVGQIPQQCGYASANTFYKAFKRCFGVSPSVLRAQASAASVENT